MCSGGLMEDRADLCWIGALVMTNVLLYTIIILMSGSFSLKTPGYCWTRRAGFMVTRLRSTASSVVVRGHPHPADFRLHYGKIDGLPEEGGWQWRDPGGTGQGELASAEYLRCCGAASNFPQSRGGQRARFVVTRGEGGRYVLSASWFGCALSIPDPYCSCTRVGLRF